MIDQKRKAQTKGKKYIDVQIPFSGFYGTHHDDQIDDAVGSALYHQKLDWYSDLERGYPSSPWDDEAETEDEKAARAALEEAAELAWNVSVEHADELRAVYAEMYVEAFCREADLNYKADTVDLDSPRYYNYTTDKIFAEIKLSDLQQLINETPDDVLAEAVADEYTSRPGFISHFDADYKTGEDWTRPLEDMAEVQRGTLLRAALEHAGDWSREAEWYLVDEPYMVADEVLNEEDYKKADELAAEWERLDKIARGITPGQGEDAPDGTQPKLIE